jgi:hypothetical protein
MIDATTHSSVSELGMRYHFFISYSGRDKEYVERITTPLQRHGLRVYFDRDSGIEDKAPRWENETRGKPFPGPTSNISNILWQELSLSLILLSIETKNYWRSKWGAQEFMFFFNQRRPIMVWHPEGDFWKTKHYFPLFYCFNKESFNALTGEKEYPFIIQHFPEGLDEAEKAAARANLFLELIEFVQWNGEEITCNNVEKYAMIHSNLKIRISELKDTILHKFNRSLNITRMPIPNLMPSKRTKRYKPWVVREKEHLERILNDEKYRDEVFRDLDRDTS